jgi:hypothetical protein
MAAAPPPPELAERLAENQRKPKPLKSAWEQTLRSRGAVLGTMFLVTGALGLPLLWYSPVFSKLEKLLWTLIVLIYTLTLLGITWAILLWCYRLLVSMN